MCNFQVSGKVFDCKGGRFIRYNIILYIAIVLMQLIILTNITLLDGSWNGITMWLCTGIFIFATTIFLLSKSQEQKSGR
ncbi:hypothetical protein MHB48_09050 [Psychrobacillus sp. FSL H8-0483]|uniref:hypothetical protein n=1 Tax=Psychrobacillus sp. FSL H8-0483 TaxID=2921389 RepID=UPI00315AA12B